MTVVPRFVIKLGGNWGDTGLDLPAGRWLNQFTGESIEKEIRLADLLKRFPVALLSLEDR